MTTYRSKATLGLAVALMLVGFTTSVYGFLGYNTGRANDIKLIQVEGKVVCVGCSLAEARQAQPQQNKYANHLFEVTHGQQQLVMEIEKVSNPEWLNYLTTPQVRLRGESSVLQQLSSPENQAKPIAMTARLTSPRTLDVTAVTIKN